MTQQTGITVMLKAAKRGDPDAAQGAFQAVYGELRKIARSHRRRWQGNHTLNTTALINEAYLKLASPAGEPWSSRTHFYATAAKAMRQILVNYAERQSAAKRGGESPHVSLDDVTPAGEEANEEVLALNQALEALGEENARSVRVVECRFFGGLSIEDTAEALNISPATVKREWKLATAWLYQRMHQ